LNRNSRYLLWNNVNTGYLKAEISEYAKYALVSDWKVISLSLRVLCVYLWMHSILKCCVEQHNCSTLFYSLEIERMNRTTTKSQSRIIYTAKGEYDFAILWNDGITLNIFMHYMHVRGSRRRPAARPMLLPSRRAFKLLRNLHSYSAIHNCSIAYDGSRNIILKFISRIEVY
jgi:hypothetical protein